MALVGSTAACALVFSSCGAPQSAAPAQQTPTGSQPKPTAVQSTPAKAATPAVPAPGPARPATPGAAAAATPPVAAASPTVGVTAAPPAAPGSANVAPKTPPKNFALNGSFEDGEAAGMANLWWSDDAKAARSTKAASGKYSMLIHPDTGSKKKKAKDLHFLRAVVRNAEPLLGKEVEVKAKVLVKPTKEIPGPLALNVLYTANGKDGAIATVFQGSDDWTEVKATGKIPADADPKSLLIAISVRPSAQEPVLIDDVSLTIK
ncbi:MAG: hypothetical protein HZB26_08970 [Candidatus Hydrogenedentes bacterium]|nr:hypothetical protein [Candidatus Hydrogenedentota bacterium]